MPMFRRLPLLADCLAGLKVLDLSQYIPGPFATLMLGDLGGRVVKIEPPEGDPMRRFGPRDADGTTPFYKALNAGKTVVRLDLKGDGAAVLRRLVEGADVLLESFRPGALERLGFGPDRLRDLNPRLVHCALSGFGQDGPWRLRAGHDLTYLALTGGLSLTGTAATPVIPFPPPADHAGAMQAVVAVLAALVRRGRTGEGASLDVSLFETALSWQYMAFGAPQTSREGDLLNGGAAYYRLYRTRDGRFLAIAAIEPKFWQAFCAAAGRPDLVARQAEPLPQSGLAAAVAALVGERSLAEWTALLDGVDCCVEPVLEPAEAAAQPHLAARRLLGAAGQVLTPIFVDGQPPHPRPPLAEAGAETVLADWA